MGDNTLVNAVLAAVKIAQGETGVIREMADSSCFHDEDGHVVCTVTGEFNLGLEVLKPMAAADLDEKVEQVRTLVSRLESERRKAPQRIDNPVDALRLESLETDHYRRAACLALFMDMERFRELQCDSVAQLRRVLLGD